MSDKREKKLQYVSTVAYCCPRRTTILPSSHRVLTGKKRAVLMQKEYVNCITSPGNTAGSVLCKYHQPKSVCFLLCMAGSGFFGKGQWKTCKISTTSLRQRIMTFQVIMLPPKQFEMLLPNWFPGFYSSLQKPKLLSTLPTKQTVNQQPACPLRTQPGHITQQRGQGWSTTEQPGLQQRLTDFNT